MYLKKTILREGREGGTIQFFRHLRVLRATLAAGLKIN